MPPLPDVRILTDKEVDAALAHICLKSKSPLLDEVYFLLSFDAGMSSPEIAAMQRSDILEGKDGDLQAIVIFTQNGLYIGDRVEDRKVSLTPRLSHVLQSLAQQHVATSHPSVNYSLPMLEGTNFVNGWFDKLYLALGLTGATACSGPTTYLAMRHFPSETLHFLSEQDRFRAAEKRLKLEKVRFLTAQGY